MPTPQKASESTGVVPKRGDHVRLSGETTVFEVSEINSLMQTANLKSMDGQGHITRNIPWTSLEFAVKK